MTATAKKPRVQRSPVPAGLTYPEYKQPLRRDFVWMCAYCTRAESEAATIGYDIDHYEPKSPNGRPDLEHTYSNLMWSCALCNSRKSDITPPPAARAAGKRLFKADDDVYSDHFVLPAGSVRVKGLTPVGEFTIEDVDLNRLDLRKLRELRRDLYRSDAVVAEGLQAIQGARIDRLPPESRFKVQRILRDLTDSATQIREHIDAQLLEMMAKSPDLDPLPDEEEVRNAERLARLRQVKAAYPGVWHGRSAKKSTSKKK